MAYGNVTLVSDGIIETEQYQQQLRGSGNIFSSFFVAGAVMLLSSFSPSTTQVIDSQVSVIKSSSSAYNVRTGVNTVSMTRQLEGNTMSPVSRKSVGARAVSSTLVRRSIPSQQDTSVFFAEQKLEYLAGDRPFKNARVVEPTTITRGFLKK
jgi:hypothetical protein